MLNHVKSGDVLAGKYRVERVLGAGGMGMVVAARHLELQTLVALKFMLGSAAANPEAARRFVQEARSAARLRSEHVARVSDYGTLESGEPYIVIEYLEGEDLAALLARSGPLPVEVAVGFMLQACEAMEEAHANGIIHRDIKPQNLFLTMRHKGTPCVKVLDFGLSKVALTGDAPAGLQQTNTTALLGSPLYMSPEQMRSARNVDHRADIWSLGATFYELLCHEVPFPADSMMDLCLKLNQGQPRALRATRSDIPVELERAVLRCLEKEPAARFASVAELAAAIAPFATPGTVLRTAEPAVPVPAPVAATSNDELAASELARRTGANWGATQDPTRSRSRSPAMWVGLGLAAAASTAGGAWFLSHKTPEPTAESPAAAQSTPAAVAAAVLPPAPPVKALASSLAQLPAVPSASTSTPPALSAAPVAAPGPATAASEPRPRNGKPAAGAARPSPKPDAMSRAAAAPQPAPAPAGATEDPWSRK